MSLNRRIDLQKHRRVVLHNGDAKQRKKGNTLDRNGSGIEERVESPIKFNLKGEINKINGEFWFLLSFYHHLDQAFVKKFVVAN